MSNHRISELDNWLIAELNNRIIKPKAIPLSPPTKKIDLSQELNSGILLSQIFPTKQPKYFEPHRQRPPLSIQSPVVFLQVLNHTEAQVYVSSKINFSSKKAVQKV